METFKVIVEFLMMKTQEAEVEEAEVEERGGAGSVVEEELLVEMMHKGCKRRRLKRKRRN